jgi:hypothetical protein
MQHQILKYARCGNAGKDRHPPASTSKLIWNPTSDLYHMYVVHNEIYRKTLSHVARVTPSMLQPPRHSFLLPFHECNVKENETSDFKKSKPKIVVLSCFVLWVAQVQGLRLLANANVTIKNAKGSNPDRSRQSASAHLISRNSMKCYVEWFEC